MNIARKHVKVSEALASLFEDTSIPEKDKLQIFREIMDEVLTMLLATVSSQVEERKVGMEDIGDPPETDFGHTAFGIDEDQPR